MGRLRKSETKTKIARCACGNLLHGTHSICSTCSKRQKDLREAEQALEPIIDNRPNTSWIRSELCRAISERASDADIVSWATRAIRLPPGDGWKGNQQLDFTRYPLAAEKLRMWKNPEVEMFVDLSGTQTGKSTMEMALLFDAMLRSGGNCIYVAPTDGLREKIPKTKILPIVENSPELGFSKSEQGNTILRWKNGRYIWVGLATSAATLADTSGCSTGVLTEYDEILASLKHDPLALTFDRIRYHHRRKMYVNGTPRRLDQMGLYALYSKTRMYVAEFPCPECGDYFIVEDTDLRWPEGADPKEIKRQKLAYVVCKSCGCEIGDKHHYNMALGARLRCLTPERSFLHVGVRTPSWYSVKLTFSEAVFEFLEAKSDLTRLSDWYKSIAAKPVDVYKLNTVGGDFSYKHRKSMGWRRERMEIPPEVKYVTAGIDVGARGFWFGAIGWGEGGRKYVIWNAMYEAKGMGTNAWDEAWARILERCDTSKYIWLGNGNPPPFTLGIIDSGYDAQCVYDLCKKPTTKRWLPAKGTVTGLTLYKKTSADPERKHGGKYAGLPLILHATHHLQDILEKSLHTPIEEDFGIAFPSDEHDRMFKHLEAAVKKDDGKGVTKWDKAFKNADDHLRDALCLAILAGEIMGYNKSDVAIQRPKQNAGEPVAIKPTINRKVSRNSERC